jgi:hypothetical protein
LLPSLETESRVVGCYVAFSQEMTPLCPLHYMSLCRLLGHFLPRDDAAVSVCFAGSFVAFIVAFSQEMTPLFRFALLVASSPSSSLSLKR